MKKKIPISPDQERFHLQTKKKKNIRTKFPSSRDRKNERDRNK